jgi:hypothetical protein
VFDKQSCSPGVIGEKPEQVMALHMDHHERTQEAVCRVLARGGRGVSPRERSEASVAAVRRSEEADAHPMTSSLRNMIVVEVGHLEHGDDLDVEMRG